MIDVSCGICGRPLESPGALLFGPPTGDFCLKIHSCRSCWRLLRSFLDGEDRKVISDLVDLITDGHSDPDAKVVIRAREFLAERTAPEET